MADGDDTAEDAPSSDLARLHAAAREARDDASPFAVAAMGVMIALSLVSRHTHWELLGHQLWWLWLVVAAPYCALAATLQLGFARLVRHDRRREIVIGLLTVVWLFTVLGVGVLVASLVSHSGHRLTGAQLLYTGASVWLTNAIAFGLAFWELDCGGPVSRALMAKRPTPDFQFPQDENPELARDGWLPRLWDYLYMSLTNSIAFSPTDAMPLTHKAKALMAAGSMLSAVTIILVASRAVNIL